MVLNLDILNQIADLHLESLRDPDKGVDGYGFLATFKIANVIAMHIGRLGQFFLAPPKLAPVGTNGLP